MTWFPPHLALHIVPNPGLVKLQLRFQRVHNPLFLLSQALAFAPTQTLHVCVSEVGSNERHSEQACRLKCGYRTSENISRSWTWQVESHISRAKYI